ncbi:MAG: META domain-containing protein [Rariglobus sp.]
MVSFKNLRFSFIVLALASGVFFAAGCQSTPSNADRHSSHTLTAYANSSWVLAAWKSDGKKVALPSNPPTLQLGYQGQVSGHAGVNRYFGTVRVNNDNLVWGDTLASTRMGGDPAQMESEVRFMTDLPKTTEVTVRSGRLIFTGKGVRLEFVRSMP